MQSRLVTAIVVILLTIGGSAATGQHTPIYGGPTYNSQTGDGYKGLSIASMAVNDAGQAVGTTTKWAQGTSQGTRAVRLDANGWTELQPLAGTARIQASAINSTGIAVGTVRLSNGGERGVRWDSNGAITELSRPVYASTNAYAINNSGQVAGYASNPVRWEPGGAMTTLTTTGTEGRAYSSPNASAINASGQMCASAWKSVFGVSQGEVAVRWSSSGQITELQTPPLFAANQIGMITRATALNDSGQVVGYGSKVVGGMNKGTRPIRWAADGTATELNTLGVSSQGSTDASAKAINNAGQAIGTATKYDWGTHKGDRAVRWESNGTVTELKNLGTSSSGFALSNAFSINSKGEAAGQARKYHADLVFEDHATWWQADGSVVDLNSLIDPSSGWLLTCAYSISDTDWITGVGTFDPDLAGPIQPYERLFLMHVPEPGTLALFVFGAIGILRRRR